MKDCNERGLTNLIVAVDSERQERCRKNLRGSLQYLTNNQVKYIGPFYSDSCTVWLWRAWCCFYFRFYLHLSRATTSGKEQAVNFTLPFSSFRPIPLCKNEKWIVVLYELWQYLTAAYRVSCPYVNVFGVALPAFVWCRTCWKCFV